ncbi:MAG: polysaccharide lyase 8 family protein [Alphaproteobacteria bacterium]|nr:polysaccharide lyase 8 family protein [Alphaproteobacteria bacterium]MBU2379365.1 polysaccharide lyase 8 family protein [Alphaproteobacteria bacterium]
MFKRRTVLEGLGAAGLLALAPASAQAQQSDQFERLERRWREMLIGGPVELMGQPFQAIRGAIDDRVAELVRGARWDRPVTELFPDLFGGNERRATSLLQRLRMVAMAWATPGSRWKGRAEPASLLRRALTRLADEQFFPGAPKEGNWWDWEIGTPLRLLDVLVIAKGELEPETLRTLLDAIDFYTPTAGYLHFDGPVEATGANRAWISSVRAGRSILRRDIEGMTAAKESLYPALAYTSAGDGFYRDGSFIQHDDVASTGAYGAAFAFLLGDLIYLVADSPWAYSDEQWAPVRSWLEIGVLPLMEAGGCMDMVRSRSISRVDVQDQETGLIFRLALARIAAVSPAASARTFANFLKKTERGNPPVGLFEIDIDAPGFQMTLDHARLAKAFIDDAAPLPGFAPSHHQFANMDRLVHRRSDFVLGLALYSSRVCNYEAVNGQNKRGWYTGHGMTYLYNDAVDHYRDGFWPTVDSYRLAGVTSDGRPVAHKALLSDPWTGGARLDDCGVMGARLSWNEGPSRATKSWFCMDEIIVCLGSGISGTGGVVLETTLENRRLRGEVSSDALRVEGAPLSAVGEPVDLTTADWLHIPELGGIVPRLDEGEDGARLLAKVEQRTGAWSDIDELNPPAPPIARNYATVWFDHGADPSNGGYAYSLLPGADAAQTRRFAVDRPVKVLRRDADCHSVQRGSDSLTAAAVWADGWIEIEHIGFLGPCAAIWRSDGDILDVSIADPTHLRESVSLRVSGSDVQLIEAADGVSLASEPTGTVVTVDTGQALGASRRLRLRTAPLAT